MKSTLPVFIWVPFLTQNSIAKFLFKLKSFVGKTSRELSVPLKNVLVFENLVSPLEWTVFTLLIIKCNLSLMSIKSWDPSESLLCKWNTGHVKSFPSQVFSVNFIFCWWYGPQYKLSLLIILKSCISPSKLSIPKLEPMLKSGFEKYIVRSKGLLKYFSPLIYTSNISLDLFIAIWCHLSISSDVSCENVFPRAVTSFIWVWWILYSIAG